MEITIYRVLTLYSYAYIRDGGNILHAIYIYFWYRVVLLDIIVMPNSCRRDWSNTFFLKEEKIQYYNPKFIFIFIMFTILLAEVKIVVVINTGHLIYMYDSSFYQRHLLGLF
jgi:hypothetical protein